MDALRTPEGPVPVLWSPHPLAPAQGRTLVPVELMPGDTLAEVMLRAGVDAGALITVAIEGELIPADAWHMLCPHPGQIVTVQAAVDGGGGKSNPVAAVLSIGLMLVAGPLGGALAGAFELGTAFTIGGFAVSWGAILGVGISIAGNMLIGAIFKPHVPALSNASGRFDQPSPTYSLSGGSNRLRPYEPMAVVFGEHRMFPDYGAKPYTEIVGDDQYLYQIFHFGVADVVLSDLRIGETPLTDYQGVTLYWANDVTGVMDGFPGNVDTSAGATLTYAAGFIIRTTALDTVRIAFDVEGALYAIDEKSGAPKALSVALQAEYRAVGSSTWLPFFTAENGYMPFRGYTPTLSGFFRNLPALLAIAIPTYTLAESNSIYVTNSTTKPVRKTYSRDVPAGQYEFRVARTTADYGDAKLVANLSFSQLRSYQQDRTTYPGEQRLGMKIKASEQLQGVVQQLSALATASTYYWTGAAWAYGPTRNPAWWFLDFVRGRKDANGRKLYGCFRPDAGIEIEQIKAWAIFCTTYGLTFDAVLDRAVAAEDWLNVIARCGLGSVSRATGKLGVVWDAPNQPVVATANMANIIAGSMQIQYITEALADEVVVSFVNPTTWQTDQVRVASPGVSSPQRSSAIELMGCRSAAMAGLFGNAQAAAQVYRRRRITWEQDFEGFVVTRGDVVLLSHDLTQWGYSGRVVAFTDATHVQLDRPVPRSGVDEFIAFTKPDGTLTIVTVLAGAVGTSADTLTLRTAYMPDATRLPMDHRWQFSPLATPGKKVKVLGVTPVSASRVRILATDEGPEYYAAWAGSYAPPPVQTLLRPAVAVIETISATEALVLSGGVVRSRITVSWSVSGGYAEARLRWRFDSGSWSDAVGVIATSYTFETDSVGQLEISATPYNGLGAPGSPATTTTTVYGKTADPVPVSGFSVIKLGGEARATWSLHPDLDVRVGGSIVIRWSALSTGATWESGVVLDTFDGGAVSGPVPLMTGTYLAKAVDSTGHHSPTAVSFVITEGMVTGLTTVATTTQHSSFGGVKSGTAAVDGVLMLDGATPWDSVAGNVDAWGSVDSLGGIAPSGIYDFDSALDMGTVATRRLEVDIAVQAFVSGDLWDSRGGDMDDWGLVDGGSLNDCDATLYASITNDDPAGAPVWGGWAPFFVGDFTCRALRFRVELVSGDPTHNISISTLAVDARIPT